MKPKKEVALFTAIGCLSNAVTYARQKRFRNPASSSDTSICFLLQKQLGIADAADINRGFTAGHTWGLHFSLGLLGDILPGLGCRLTDAAVEHFLRAGHRQSCDEIDKIFSGVPSVVLAIAAMFLPLLLLLLILCWGAGDSVCPRVAAQSSPTMTDQERSEWLCCLCMRPLLQPGGQSCWRPVPEDLHACGLTHPGACYS